MFDAPTEFFDLNSSFKQELIVGKGCASCYRGHAVKIHTWWQMLVHISHVLSVRIQHLMKLLRLRIPYLFLPDYNFYSN